MEMIVFQEEACITGVLCRNKIRLLQDPEGPQGDVLHVSKRSGNDIQDPLFRNEWCHSPNISFTHKLIKA